MFSITWNPNTIRSFQLSFPTVTVPIEEIRGIVEANFIHWSDGKHSGFNKINAIKELRGHFQLQTNKYYVMYGNTNLKIGLREAKEMIEAVYEEGIEAGNYRGNHESVSRPEPAVPYDLDGDTDEQSVDDLPF